MLLLFSASCSKEHKEVVDVEFDPDKTYTMKATDVSSLISDSGITRYRLKAKEWQIYGKAAEPHWYFPEGIYGRLRRRRHYRTDGGNGSDSRMGRPGHGRCRFG